VLLVSDRLLAGEARGAVVFPKAADSVTVNDTARVVTVDSVVFGFTLVARDTLVHGLQVFLYRVSRRVDSTTTFAALEAQLTAAALLDSVAVAVSQKTGDIRFRLQGETLGRLAVPPEDSGRFGLALGIRAQAPTGIRLSNSTSLPKYTTYGRVEVADTAKQHQTQGPVSPDRGLYVLSREPPADADLLVLGGRRGSRVLIRFQLPALIHDSGQLIRAALALTPTEPLYGLPNDGLGGSLVARGVLADLGPKSPPLTSAALFGSVSLKEGSADTIRVDVRQLVEQWRVKNGPPPVLFLGLDPEGGSFMQPSFFSTRSPAGGPRLRITYALPTHPGRP
jgi:hypothetical protein